MSFILLTIYAGFEEQAMHHAQHIFCASTTYCGLRVTSSRCGVRGGRSIRNFAQALPRRASH